MKKIEKSKNQNQKTAKHNQSLVSNLYANNQILPWVYLQRPFQISKHQQISRQRINSQQSSFRNAAGHAVWTAGLLDQFLAVSHPLVEAILRAVCRKVVPHFLLSVCIARPFALEPVRRRPSRQLSHDTRVVHIENLAEMVHAVDIVLLARIRALPAIAQTPPPGHAPAQRQQNVAELLEKSQVRVQRDALPFDVVKVTFQLAEAFDLEHAAEDARQLRGKKNVLAVFGIANVHQLVFRRSIQRHKAVRGPARHVVPLRKKLLYRY